MSNKTIFQKMKHTEYLKLEKHPLFFWFFSAVIIEVCVELLSRRSILSTILFFLDSPIYFLINVSIIMVPLGLMLLTKRGYFIHKIVTFLFLLLGLADFILLLFRTTPFNAHDFSQIDSAKRVMEHYIPVWLFITAASAAGVLLLVLLFIWWKRTPVIKEKIRRTRHLLWQLLNLGIVVFAFSGLTHTSFLPARFANVAQAYQDYGLVYCFISSMVNTGISRPSDYKEVDVPELVDANAVPEKNEGVVEGKSDGTRYGNNMNSGQTGSQAGSDLPGETKQAAEQEHAANPEQTGEQEHAGEQEQTEKEGETGNDHLEEGERTEDQKLLGESDSAVNVIFLQLESFYDVTKLKDLELTTDPMPFIHSLEEQYSTGFLSVPCVGAGTANTEFEVMTGMNLDFFGPGEYPYQTVLQNKTCESLAYIFHDLGYTSQAIHNNSAYFYDRCRVFSQLGYDVFTSIEYMQDVTYTETGWAKDSVLVPNIIEALASTASRDYIYTISVQGHGSYPDTDILGKPLIRAVCRSEDGEVDEGRSMQFQYYVNQEYEMDKFVRDLVRELEVFGEPTVLVLYGDHLPSLGITEEEMTEGNLFQTRYVIWDNIGLARKERDVETYQLGALVLQDIQISEGILFRYHQKFFEEQGEDHTPGDTDESAHTVYDSDSSDYLDRMALIAYDMLYGDQTVYGGENPYQPTKLKLGVDPIKLSAVFYDEETKTLTVTGSHFNSFSIVIVNGKMVTPEVWMSDRLIAEGIDPLEQASVRVGQLDDYSKALLTTTVSYVTNLGDFPESSQSDNRVRQ